MSSPSLRLRQSLRDSPALALTGFLLVVSLLWVFGATLSGLANRWAIDSRYSHGWLVPLFSLYLLWSRWGSASSMRNSTPSWWGLPLLLAGLLLSAAGTYIYFDWLNSFALVCCVAALVVLLGGWRALAWAWPAVAFLLFMLPLPYRLEVAMAHPLQRVATFLSSFALQTLGFPAFSEGNVIRMGAIRVGVVEACSGLSMLMIFFALCTAVAIVIRRPWPDRLLLVASAIPIAVLANVTRIIVTVILYKVAGRQVAEMVFHDLAGWLMMPLALGMLWAELRVLSWVLVPRPVENDSAALAFAHAVPTPSSEKAAGKQTERNETPPAPVAHA